MHGSSKINTLPEPLRALYTLLLPQGQVTARLSMPFDAAASMSFLTAEGGAAGWKSRPLGQLLVHNPHSMHFPLSAPGGFPLSAE
jgi:hypothetical protein